MPTLAATLRTEIRRLASKELRKVLRPLRRFQKQMRGVRLISRQQRRALASLERRLLRLRSRTIGNPGTATGGGGPRVSPESIRSLRSRLGMTRKEFAKLVAVSPGSIFGWETGRTVPRGKSRARVVEIRKMGLKAARQRLAGEGRVSRRRRGQRRRKSKA
jgi:hypothetical protein